MKIVFTLLLTLFILNSASSQNLQTEAQLNAGKRKLYSVKGGSLSALSPNNITVAADNRNYGFVDEYVTLAGAQTIPGAKIFQNIKVVNQFSGSFSNGEEGGYYNTHQFTVNGNSDSHRFYEEYDGRIFESNYQETAFGASWQLNYDGTESYVSINAGGLQTDGSLVSNSLDSKTLFVTEWAHAASFYSDLITTPKIKARGKTQTADFSTSGLFMEQTYFDFGGNNLVGASALFAANNGTKNYNGSTNPWNLGAIAGVVGTPDKITNYPGGLAFYTKPADNSLSGVPAERMRIDYNGNVGIATNTPRAKLHVNSTGADLNQNHQFTGDLIIQANTGGRSAAKGAELEFVIPANTDGGNPWGQGRIITVAGNTESSNATGKMILGTRRMYDKLGTGPQWYYGNDIVIDGTGNVGIGTLTPKNYKLAVAGPVIAESVKVALQASWPDYVFAKSYKLPALSDVEKYIRENNHLPEIPSAAEAEKEGVNLGDMNTKLLQKIEELTLYMIGLKKENEKQQKEIDNLKKKF